LRPRWRRSRGMTSCRSYEAPARIDGSPWNYQTVLMSAIAATAIGSRSFGVIGYPNETRLRP
jgi:hypothetical protein